MAITIHVSCSMCGGESGKPELEIDISSWKQLNPMQLNAQTLKREIESRGWIVQLNGDNMDTYCTKKCAE